MSNHPSPHTFMLYNEVTRMSDGVTGCVIDCDASFATVQWRTIDGEIEEIQQFDRNYVVVDRWHSLPLDRRYLPRKALVA